MQEYSEHHMQQSDPTQVPVKIEPCPGSKRCLTCFIGGADVLSVTIWLVPARKENIAVNVPPYLNAETTVLQDINDTGYFQASAHALNAVASPCMLPGCTSAQLLQRSMHSACMRGISTSVRLPQTVDLQKAVLQGMIGLPFQLTVRSQPAGNARRDI